MELTINIPDELLELFEAEGELRPVVEAAIRKEGLRLYHIARSRPKAERSGGSTVGRPRLTPAEKMVRERGDVLRAIYLKLRGMYGDDYPRLFGEQEVRLEQLIAAQDVAAILQFEKEQPWIRK